MAAYISRTLLKKEFNEYKSQLNIKPIGMPYTPFGQMMNDKYKFKDKELDKLNLQDSYKHIKSYHSKKA